MDAVVEVLRPKKYRECGVGQRQLFGSDNEPCVESPQCPVRGNQTEPTRAAAPTTGLLHWNKALSRTPPISSSMWRHCGVERELSAQGYSISPATMPESFRTNNSILLWFYSNVGTVCTTILSLPCSIRSTLLIDIDHISWRVF
jgi:hypothetical protein